MLTEAGRTTLRSAQPLVDRAVEEQLGRHLEARSAALGIDHGKLLEAHGYAKRGDSCESLLRRLRPPSASPSKANAGRGTTRAGRSRTAIIEVENLWNLPGRHRGRCAASPSFLQEGEFFGFLGPNSAGKSTTIKVLITLLHARPQAKARVFGYDVSSEATVIRTLIGYAAQEVGVDDELTGPRTSELRAACTMDPSVLRKRIRSCWTSSTWRRTPDRMASSYSGGMMRKRLDLATGLIHRPQLLFLDEPTTSLDPQNRAGIWAYLEG